MGCGKKRGRPGHGAEGKTQASYPLALYRSIDPPCTLALSPRLGGEGGRVTLG
jgi:hypothetical protein